MGVSSHAIGSPEFIEHNRQVQAHDDLVRILETGEDAVSREIRWTKFSGGETACGIGPYPISQDSERKAELLAWAKECGWTPKRWWKFWRWEDADYPDRLYWRDKT